MWKAGCWSTYERRERTQHHSNVLHVSSGSLSSSILPVLGALAMGSRSCWGASECDVIPGFSASHSTLEILCGDVVIPQRVLIPNKQSFFYLVDNSKYHLKVTGMNAAADKRPVWSSTSARDSIVDVRRVHISGVAVDVDADTTVIVDFISGHHPRTEPEYASSTSTEVRDSVISLSVPFVLHELDEMQQPQQPAPPSTVAPSVSASATPLTTAAATGGAPTTVIVSGGADSAFAPPPFRGIETDDAELWMSRFEKYVAYRQLPVQEQLNLFAVLLRDEASDWFDNLETTVRAAWPALKEAFEQRFQDSELLR